MDKIQTKSFEELLEEAHQLRAKTLGKCIKKGINTTKEYVQEVLELPPQYRPLILSGGVIGIVIGWTVLIWLPGSTVAIPIALTHWAKKREGKNK